MKYDQIAFYCSTSSCALFVKRMLGLEHAEWTEDIVVGMSSVRGKPPEKNIAELKFYNPPDGGCQIELIHYVQGPNWHELSSFQREPYFSHFGIHLDEGEEFPEVKLPAKVVQETFTQKHTSEFLNRIGRTYHYRIIQFSVGHYIKYIRRQG